MCEYQEGWITDEDVGTDTGKTHYSFSTIIITIIIIIITVILGKGRIIRYMGICIDLILSNLKIPFMPLW